MSPRTAEQNEAIRQQKRQVIMDAALEVFAHDGFHSASMSKVAKEAGISKGLTYSYFESKEELLKAILLQGMQEINVMEKFPDGLKSKESMIEMLDYYMKAVDENQTYWKLYFSLVVQSDLNALFGEEFHEMINHLYGQFTDYFAKKGVEDPLTEAMLFGAMMDGVFLNYLMNPMHYDIEKVKRIIINKFF